MPAVHDRRTHWGRQADRGREQILVQRLWHHPFEAPDGLAIASSQALEFQGPRRTPQVVVRALTVASVSVTEIEED
jgi:hypothetical protein